MGDAVVHKNNLENKNTNIDENNRRKNIDVDDIDDFAQALLDRKNEMSIFSDDEEITSESLSNSKRKDAEKTMSEALNMLRKERGQVSIEEEEEEYLYDQNKNLFENPILEESDEKNQQALVENQKKNVRKDSKKPKSKRVKKKKKDESEEKLIEDNRKEKKSEKVSSKELEKEKKKEKKKKKEKNIHQSKKEKEQEYLKTKPVSSKEIKAKKRKRNWIIFFIAFVALLLGGYAYKVSIYDPAHVVSEEQQKIFDKLIDYADGWDMNLESEDFELIDMEDEYNKLTENQQEKIDEYFTERTGSNFRKLLKEVKTKERNQADEKNEDYQKIIGYLNGWKNKTDAEKYLIIGYKDVYKNLSPYLKEKIDDLCTKESGSTFSALCSEQEKIKSELQEESEKANKKDSEQLLIKKQNRLYEVKLKLTEFNRQLESAEIYQKGLKEQLESGMDVESLIESNNETISYLKTQITALQSEQDTLENEIKALQ